VLAIVVCLCLTFLLIALSLSITQRDLSRLAEYTAHLPGVDVSLENDPEEEDLEVHWAQVRAMSEAARGESRAANNDWGIL
jgi:hypothetical protein